MSKLTSFLLIICSVFLLNNRCATGKNDRKSIPQKEHKDTRKHQKFFKLKDSEKERTAKLGDTIIFEFASRKQTNADSVKLTVRENEQVLVQKSDLVYEWATDNVPGGIQNLRFLIYFNDSLSEVLVKSITLFATSAPRKLNYKIVRKFWHDPEAYTQGLLYYNGYLYESTGHKNHSSLRKLSPQTGKIIQKYDLDNQYFGEGIARIGEEVYMLTWLSQKGFVFDINNFNVKRKFDLQTLQGWGLTNDKSTLILSDGSENLYYYDPVYFTQIKQISVCDDQKMVSQLNELEFTDKGLFANLYGQKEIVLIDLQTSTAIGILNLSDLFPEGIPDDMDHVLNGIAYNPDTNSYFVTGKYWPVMYEINVLF